MSKICLHKSRKCLPYCTGFSSPVESQLILSRSWFKSDAFVFLYFLLYLVVGLVILLSILGPLFGIKAHCGIGSENLNVRLPLVILLENSLKSMLSMKVLNYMLFLLEL